jgi:hypothetical protein
MSEGFDYDTMDTYARLSQGAYGSKDIDGWQRDPDFSDDQRTVYYRDKDDGTKEAVLSFRGTELKKGTWKQSFRDIQDDVALGLGLQNLNSRFRRAGRLAKDVSNKYDGNLTLTGHSLGGSQALYASNSTGLPAHVYSAGVSPIEWYYNAPVAFGKSVMKLFKKPTTPAKSYVTLLDPISNFSLFDPTVKTYIVPQKYKSPHSIENYLT